MSIFGQPPGQGSNANPSPASVYGRGDLQSAFNWLVNQPEHVRKQASDPDRLMTLYYRSSGRPEMIRGETARIETEAPVSGQNFISDLRQINEAMRQFDGPTSQATVHTSSSSHYASASSVSAPHVQAPAAPSVTSPVVSNSPGKTQAIVNEVREKLNLSSDAEALNALVAIGYRSLKPLLG